MIQFIRWYSKKYTIIDEYITPPEGFTSINQFFTRQLKQGARPIERSQYMIVSPVDARIDQYGTIEGNRVLQAKGIHYTLDALIPSPMASSFFNGSFITLYLSPGDYHRIHSPVNGIITGYFAIPGSLFTVQEYMVKGLEGLYTLNERLITYIESHRSLVAVCKIGAMNVGRISLSYATNGKPSSGVITNKTFRKPEEQIFTRDMQIALNAGDEIGRFNLGSTVILLFQKGAIRFEKLERSAKVRMGERIATFNR